MKRSIRALRSASLPVLLLAAVLGGCDIADLSLLDGEPAGQSGDEESSSALPEGEAGGEVEGDPEATADGAGDSEGDSEPWAPVEGSVDLSGFRGFTLDRRVAAECAAGFADEGDDDQPLFVHIWETEEGVYWLVYLGFQFTEAADGEGPDPVIAEVPLADRALTDAEFANLREAFSALKVDPARSGATCNDVDGSCCTTFAWDDLTFTDLTPGIASEELQRISQLLLQLRHGLLDDGAPPALTLEHLVGTYHDRRSADAINLTITVDGRCSWELDGCDTIGGGVGEVVEEDGEFVIYLDDDPHGGPFCDYFGCTDQGVRIEPIDEDTFATKAFGKLVLWDRGRVCPVCLPGLLGPSGVKPCD